MKIYLIIGACMLVLASTVCIQQYRIDSLKEERDTYQKDTYTLLSEVETYRTTDSLYVASIEELILTIGEYKKYRQADMKLIESLKADKSRLQQITTAQTQTVYELGGTVRDSIVYRDNYITDTLRCLSIHEPWFDMDGCIGANSKFAGRFESRDSLLYVEHIVPKRFWFIKWGVKERRQEIVSKNPYTRITGAEFVTIRK